MALRSILAVAAMVILALSGCATSGAANNTTYAQPQGMGPDATIGGDRSSGMGPSGNY